MITNAFLKATTFIYGSILPMQLVRPMVVCNDGFTISVQASENNYCLPRINGASEYKEVEVGYPSQAEDDLLDYAEDPEDPTNTVYGYVPVDIIDKIIMKHGGIQVQRVLPDLLTQAQRVLPNMHTL